MATEHLTKATFKEIIFDYEAAEEWSYKGEVPCIIDFYADWCGPCKMVAPILEDLAEEYGSSIKIYKIDTEAEKELAGMFGIRSIPSILFVPQQGKPQMMMGALPKENFRKMIKELFAIEKP